MTRECRWRRYRVAAAVASLFLTACGSEVERAPGPTGDVEAMQNTMEAAPDGMKQMYDMIQQGGTMDPQRMEEMQNQMFPQGYPTGEAGRSN